MFYNIKGIIFIKKFEFLKFSLKLGFSKIRENANFKNDKALEQ